MRILRLISLYFACVFALLALSAREVRADDKPGEGCEKRLQEPNALANEIDSREAQLDPVTRGMWRDRFRLPLKVRRLLDARARLKQLTPDDVERISKELAIKFGGAGAVIYGASWLPSAYRALFDEYNFFLAHQSNLTRGIGMGLYAKWLFDTWRPKKSRANTLWVCAGLTAGNALCELVPLDTYDLGAGMIGVLLTYAGIRTWEVQHGLRLLDERAEEPAQEAEKPVPTIRRLNDKAS